MDNKELMKKQLSEIRELDAQIELTKSMRDEHLSECRKLYSKLNELDERKKSKWAFYFKLRKEVEKNEKDRRKGSP